jgi:dipeptidase E
MKLYLSSYRIPALKPFSDFINKAPHEIKMGLVLNGKDNKAPEERLIKKNELLGYFSELGFAVQEINLLEHVGDNSVLLKKFKEFDVVWFNGGNTYCLRWAIAQSGCESVLKKALESGVVYGGDSAGALIVGPTLKYFDIADDPKAAPEAIYEGLGLVDFVVVPHWNSGVFGQTVTTVKNSLEKEGYKTVTLTDEEFLLIEDGKILAQ